ncbi:pentraxin fusion protein-like [Protopterus annectens]|uniref:pentraxin fusion protein-like n=1 Tax=Protopterus annectens TaxID=7888 RepID=UPI001CFA83FB|nr:pentraxin fusion protein-like [Protopterus annectens]
MLACVSPAINFSCCFSLALFSSTAFDHEEYVFNFAHPLFFHSFICQRCKQCCHYHDDLKRRTKEDLGHLHPRSQSGKYPTGLRQKAFVFPEPTANSYVILNPSKPLQLTAFTLCMRVATEETDETIIFAYRTQYYDELNLWRERNGTYSIYFSGPSIYFTIPPLNTFFTHLCVTWESKSGLTAFWVNGKRSVRKVFRKGHTIRSEGTVIIGQDPDLFLGGFDINQSFVGEISDLNMWDYILTSNDIAALSDGYEVAKGNIFHWSDISYEIKGNVIVQPINDYSAV